MLLRVGVLLGQFQRVLGIASRLEDVDRCLHVEVGLAGGNEAVQLVDVLEFGVAVQEQCGVVFRGVDALIGTVEMLEVCRKVLDAVGVEEPSNDIAGRRVSDGEDVLGDRAFPVAFAVFVVAVHEVDLVDFFRSKIRRLGEQESLRKELHLVEELQLFRGVLLPEPEDELVPRDDEDCTKLSCDCRHRLVWVESVIERHKLVLEIVQVDFRARGLFMVRHDHDVTWLPSWRLSRYHGEGLLAALKGRRTRCPSFLPVLCGERVDAVVSPNHEEIPAWVIGRAVLSAAPRIQLDLGEWCRIHHVEDDHHPDRHQLRRVSGSPNGGGKEPQLPPTLPETLAEL
mmetsp:Transcript_5159/g.15169  ORF Transcript_5159/g.15169 Transcript_5159/m.15169 type:complete len:341 (-) Transcript_5159:131-1153(-)